MTDYIENMQNMLLSNYSMNEVAENLQLNYHLVLPQILSSNIYNPKVKKMTNRAIKYRVYPTTEQSVMFAKTFGCCRKVYNLMLSDKIEGYKATGKFPTVTPAKYKKDYLYLKEIDSLALANVQLNLQSAFKNRFSKSRKKNNGFPKFKSAKHSRKSYTTNNQKGTVAIIDNQYIKLPKIGKVKAVIHRIPDDSWVIKSATISQESDGKYYISVLFEFENIANTYVADKNNAISLDYASDGLYVDNNGNVDTNHKYYQNYNGGGLMHTTDNLRFVMDETSVPYEQNENPFPQTDLDDEFETMIINKYHLTTKEMEDTN